VGFRAVWSKDSSHTNIMTCVLARPSASSAYGATGAYGARPVGQIIWQRTALRNCMPDIIICDPNKAVEGHIYQGPATHMHRPSANSSRARSRASELLLGGCAQPQMKPGACRSWGNYSQQGFHNQHDQIFKIWLAAT